MVSVIRLISYQKMRFNVGGMEARWFALLLGETGDDCNTFCLSASNSVVIHATSLKL